MKRIAPVLSLSAVLLVAALLPLAHSQETKKDKDKPAAAKAKGAEAPAAKKGRLPSNYGQLDLSDEQRDKIYAIQAKHQTGIEKLEAQLEELRNKRDAETHAVLTKTQQKKLKELNDETKKRREAKEE